MREFKLRLEDYLKDGVGRMAVFQMESIHNGLNVKIPLVVVVEMNTDNYTGGVSNLFSIFVDGVFVSNSMILNYPLNGYETYRKIGKDMADEYLSYCDFSEIDEELQGECPYGKHTSTNKENLCEECPYYRNGLGKDSEEACLGPLFHVPPYVLSWGLENNLNSLYGEGSVDYDNYTKRRILNIQSTLRDVFSRKFNNKKEIKKVKKELINAIKKM